MNTAGRTAISPITLADLARHAGLGQSTVSRVLRGRQPFSDTARDKVMRAAQALNYTPNRLAGSLASMTSNLVGIVVPSIGNAVMPEVLAGALDVLEAEGFQSIICATNFDPLQEEAVIHSIMSWRPHGLILAGLEHTARTRGLLKKGGVRVVELLDTDGEGIDIVVGSSHAMAGRHSAEFLLARNYRRIGYVGHNIAIDLRGGKRLAGFRSVLEEHGLTFAAEDISGQALSSLDAGREGLARLLGRGIKIDAVYFSSDNLALGAYFYCLEKGISIPGDLALFGYNGLDIAGLIPHPLSTIRTPRALIGQTGARLLLDDTVQAQTVDLGFQRIDGKTC